MNLTIALAESVDRQQAAENARLADVRAALAERASDDAEPESARPTARPSGRTRRPHWSHRLHGARIAH